MKKEKIKRIIAICLLLTTVFSCTEWPEFASAISAEAATHVHTADCYKGEAHVHGNGCIQDITCTAGCSKHVHKGHPNYKSQCYQGTYTDVICWACEGTGLIDEDTLVMSTEGSCDRCGVCGSWSYWNNWVTIYTCKYCGDYHKTYLSNGCSSCGDGGVSDGGEGEIDCDCLPQQKVSCDTCGGDGIAKGYSLSCGFTEDSYVINNVLCSSCGGDNKLCSLPENVFYYNGVVDTPICEQVVINLVPDAPTQTIIAGQSINKKATAYFLDGTNLKVDCTVTNYNENLYNTAQTVTFSYGTYKNNAKTAGPYSVTVSITVQGEFQLTVTSEDTNKGTVSNSTGKVLCNKSVSISATANTGYSFAGWYKDGNWVTNNNPYTFNMPAADTSYVAKFSANPYTMTVKSQNDALGSVSGGGTYNYGSSVTIKASPTTGYSFAGWYDGTTRMSTNATYTFTMPAKNYTLEAKFTPVSMTVSFNGNGGTASFTSKTVYYNEGYGTLPTATRSGYVFMGWYTAASGGTKVTAGTAVKNTGAHTLYAQWSAVGVSSITVIYDRTYPTLPAPTRPGYNFGGWYWEEIGNNGYGTQLKAGDVVKITETTTVYAKWTPKTPKIKFDSNGGSACSDKTVTYDKYIGTLPKSTKTNSIFMGWCRTEINNNGVGDPISESQLVDFETDITLYAKWDSIGSTATTIISYNANDGTFSDGTKIKDVSRTYPGTYAHPASPTKPGCTFAGWYTAASGGTSVANGATITNPAPHTLYAHWTTNATYTLGVKGTLDGATVSSMSSYVTFDIYIDGVKKAEDVSAYSVGGYASGTEYSISDVKAKTGYTVTSYSPTSGTITANTTITITMVRNTYKLTLDVNGGTKSSGDSSPYTMTYGTGNYNDISWGLPTKTGYTFTGWYTAASGGTQVYNASGKCTKEGTYFNNSGIWIYTANVTLYAQYTPVKPTVYFIDGSTTVETRVVQYDEMYKYNVSTGKEQSFPTRSKDGHIFLGWYTAASGGTQVIETDIVKNTANHSLYAQWKADTYTVLLDQQGATEFGTTSVEATYAKAMPSITLPKKKGVITYNGNGGTPAKTSETVTHTFGGYFTDILGNGTQYYTSTGTSARNWNIPENSILFAKWTDISIDLPSASRTGYDFKGWYADKNGGELIGLTGDSYVPVGNRELFATWSPKTFTVTFNPNGGAVTPTSKKVTYDETYGELPIATRTGYEFTGWWTTATGGAKVTKDDVVKLTANQTLYAHWSAITNNLPLDPQGATTPSTPNPVVATYDKDMPAITVPKRDYVVTFNTNGGTCATSSLTAAYIFGGYFTQPEGGGTKYYNANGSSARKWDWISDTTLYAKWTSVSITLPEPSRTGYTFVGWYTAASGGTKIGMHADTYTPTGHITLYAHWTPNKYNVTLDQQSATTNGTTSIVATFDAVMPNVTVPKRSYTVYFDANTGVCSTTKLTSNYVFDGYFTGTNGSGNQYYKADGTSYRTWNIPNDTTLYAKWTSTAVVLPKPTKLGYTFQGWFTAASGGTKIEMDGKNYIPTKDITLYAQWKANDVNVTYDLQGNKASGSTTPQINPAPPVVVTYDKAFNVANPTRVGYTFLGWNITGMDTACTHHYGNNTTTAASITKTKETVFKNLHSTLNSTVNFAAQWENNTYTVTLNTNASGANPAAKLNYDSFNIIFDTTGHIYGGSTKTNYLASNLPTRTGYTFTGWWTKASGGVKVYNADGSAVKEGTYFNSNGWWVYPNNVTLYAQWTANNYNITINGNKGSGSTTVNVPYSAVRLTFDSTNHYYNNANHSDYLKQNLASRVGYLFDGYFTAASGGTKLYNSDGTIANNGTVTYSGYESGYYFYQNKYKYANALNIYAQWTPITYYMAYDPGNGTVNGTNPTEAKYDKSFNVIKPIHNIIGYKFTGWNITNTAGYTGAVTNSMLTSYLNLTHNHETTVHFAATYEWADVLYKITFYANPLEYQLLASDVAFASWNANGKVSVDSEKAIGFFSTKGGTTAGTYEEQNVPYGGAFPQISATGATFLGWNTKPDGSGTYYTEAPIQVGPGELVLYAIWRDDLASVETSSTNVWRNSDAFVKVTAQSKATGVYRIWQKLTHRDGTTIFSTDWYPASYSTDLNRTPSVTEVLGDSGLSNDSNMSRFDRNIWTMNLTYDRQGTYYVSSGAESRSVNDTRPITGDTITHNDVLLRIDKTIPAITKISVFQDTLANHKSELPDSVYGGTLNTTFEVVIDDTAKEANGKFLYADDTSGIKSVVLTVYDIDKPSSMKTYVMPVKTTVTPTKYDSHVLKGIYSISVDLYSDFPDAGELMYTITTTDYAGNVSTGDITTTELLNVGFGFVYGDIELSNIYVTKSLTGFLQNFCIYTEIYNEDDKWNKGTSTYFQSGEFGYVKIWTHGYVDSVMLDFGKVNEESEWEIANDLLENKYKLNRVVPLNSTSKGSYLCGPEATFGPDGTWLRIPTYYELEPDGNFNPDGTPTYTPEKHTMYVYAEKNGYDNYYTDEFILYDTISNDVHYRVWPLE